MNRALALCEFSNPKSQQNKKPCNKSYWAFYGAPDGMISEPDFEIFSIIDTEETALLLRRVEKLIAA